MAVNPSTFGPCPQFVNAAGDPAVGDQLFFYAAGTTTKQNTYTNSTGSVANSNPIVLDALGQPSTEIWFTNGDVYKMVWAPSTDTDPPTNPIRTFDNLRGIGDSSAVVSSSEWILSTSVPTYVSATSFTVPGNQTALLTAGRRLKTTNTSGTIYSTILTSVYSALTTITVSNDSGVLDSGLSDVSYGILSATNPSVPNSQAFRQTMGIGYGNNIASSATLDLTARTGSIVDVTGTTETSAITLESGGRVLTIAIAAWPINVAGILVYTCNAGDMVEWNKDLAGTLRAAVYKNGQAPCFIDSPFDLTASVGSSALTITLKKGGWFFRNPTLGTGAFEYVKTDSDLTLTISSGSTIGGVNAVQTDVLVRVANDSGTLRLTAENIKGGMDASETGVISTTAEGGSGGADSATTIYSGTAVTSKSYRVAGLVQSTQATTGTWATSPSLVQGTGGNALVSMSSLGYGQTWQTPTRSVGTTYYNTTGKPIQMSIRLDQTSGGAAEFRINGVNFQTLTGSAVGNPNFVQLVIPPGDSYGVFTTVNPLTLVYWNEMR